VVDRRDTMPVTIGDIHGETSSSPIPEGQGEFCAFVLASRQGKNLPSQPSFPDTAELLTNYRKDTFHDEEKYRRTPGQRELDWASRWSRFWPAELPARRFSMDVRYFFEKGAHEDYDT